MNLRNPKQLVAKGFLFEVNANPLLVPPCDLAPKFGLIAFNEQDEIIRDAKGADNLKTSPALDKFRTEQLIPAP